MNEIMPILQAILDSELIPVALVGLGITGLFFLIAYIYLRLKKEDELLVPFYISANKPQDSLQLLPPIPNPIPTIESPVMPVVTRPPVAEPTYLKPTIKTEPPKVRLSNKKMIFNFIDEAKNGVTFGALETGLNMNPSLVARHLTALRSEGRVRKMKKHYVSVPSRG